MSILDANGVIACAECGRQARAVRDQLQAENDRLREEVRHLKKGDVLHVLTDQELAEQQKHEREMQASINALDDENAKLRELLVGAFKDMDAWQRIIAGSNEWGYGKGCLDRLCELRDAMQELGMEVVVR